MAKRSKKDVERFLNSLVGDKVNAKCGIYNGQCVSLPKALYEYLGIPNPYAGRGNAKDVGDTLLAQNIAEKGSGTLNVCINRDMGRIGGEVYGHIWLSLKGVANYEQNGAVALHTTKNTRPISQAQQIVNLDKWLEEEEEMLSAHMADIIVRFYRGTSATKTHNEKYVGKVTADHFAKLIAGNKSQVAAHEKLAKAGKLDMVNHLPANLRRILK